MIKYQRHLSFLSPPFSSHLFKTSAVLCTHLCSYTGNYTREPVLLLNMQTRWFWIASTGRMNMLLLQAVTLSYDYHQTYFWWSLLPSDTHSPPWQGKPNGLHGCALNHRPTISQKKPNPQTTQQTISRFKIRQQPWKHMRRHKFPGKAYKKVAVRDGGIWRSATSWGAARNLRWMKRFASSRNKAVTKLGPFISLFLEVRYYFSIPHITPQTDSLSKKDVPGACCTHKTGKRQRQLWGKKWTSNPLFGLFFLFLQ